MRNGFILLHRQGITPEEWKHPIRTLAWIDLLTLTNYENSIVTVSYGFLAARWRCSKDTAYQWMKHWIAERQLERTGERDTERNAERFFVVNYAKYQKTAERVAERTTERQPERGTEQRYNVMGTPSVETVIRSTNAVRPETEDTYKLIGELCVKYGLTNDVNINALDVSVCRHVTTIRFRAEIPRMFTWLIEKGRDRVTASGVAGWFEQAKKIQKREQLRQLERKEAEINPAAAERRKKLKDKPEGFSQDQSVSDFVSAQSV